MSAPKRIEVRIEVPDSVMASMVDAEDPAGLAALCAEGQFDAWIKDGTSERQAGYSDWVAYVPSAGRAVHVSNGDPIWFDASSLADAVARVQAGEVQR